MKKLLLFLCIISPALISSSTQSNHADNEALALVQFEKALATIESEDFVIIVDPDLDIYRVYGDVFDVTKFLAYEKEHLILQGIVSGDYVPAKLKVSEYNQVTDKKGNVNISMHVFGFYLTGKIEISLRKTAGDVAHVTITSYVKDFTRRFSGRLVARSESNYLKRPGEI